MLSGCIQDLLRIKHPSLQLRYFLLELRPLICIHCLHSKDLAYCLETQQCCDTQSTQISCSSMLHYLADADALLYIHGIRHRI